METHAFIEVAYGNSVTEKQTREVQIKMCCNNRKLLIATLYNLLLAPDL